MKLWSVFIKSLKEQLRSFWMLVLTLSLGPFFILVYYLIVESSKVHYDILFLNKDAGITVNGTAVNYGLEMVSFVNFAGSDTTAFPLSARQVSTLDDGIEKLKDKSGDALIVIHDGFTQAIINRMAGDSSAVPHLEFIGDLTQVNYMVSAIWGGEYIQQFILEKTNGQPVAKITETGLGSSATISEFDMVVPGLLIVSLIMLMFTASIAFVAEVEQKTIIRLKLSNLTAWDFLGGIGFVQILVGILAALISLGTALALGFNYSGSVGTMILISGLTSISIIAFSLLIAAATRSAAEVLIVGNFPMFLFMFFTGAAFPLKPDPWFTIWGIPVSLQGLMTPTHAISALNKTLILDSPVSGIFPEILAIAILSVFYFLIGGYFFQRRHLRMTE